MHCERGSNFFAVRGYIPRKWLCNLISFVLIFQSTLETSLFCVVLNLNSYTLQVSIFETQKVRFQSHTLGINPQPQKAQTLFTLCRVPLKHNNYKNQLSFSKYLIDVVHY
jgi:hypothetical protein